MKDFRIGQTVRINMPRSEILHGREFEVDDVIRCIFTREPIALVLKIGSSLCTMYPEECEVVAATPPT